MIEIIEIPGMKLGAALNSRTHWAMRAARARKERAVIFNACKRLGEFHAPDTVELIRVAPRMLDDDNLAGAFKAVRDEIAYIFGVDDGPKGPITWRYAQRKGAPKQYAIEIAMEWGDE